MSEPVIRIRHAVEADGRAIGDAHGSAWEAAYGHVFEQPFLAEAAESRRVVWLQSLGPLLIEPSFVLVSEVDGTVRGFAHGAPAADDDAAGEIHGFYTHPAAWGTGSAMLLMTEACAILATSWTEVVVWTLQDAHRARRFYEKAGYRLTGKEKRETLSNWLTGEAVERAAVQYGKPL